MGKTVRIKEVMSTQLLSVAPDATVLAISQLMAKRDIGSVLVKSGEQIIGIVTEKDIIRKVVAVGLTAGDVKADTVMSSPVSSIDQEATLEEARRQMGEQNIRHLLVTAKGKPSGMISVRTWLGG
jgi:CBS domain-containing protein